MPTDSDFAEIHGTQLWGVGGGSASTQPVEPVMETAAGGVGTDNGASFWLTHPNGGSNNVISGPISVPQTPAAPDTSAGRTGGSEGQGGTTLPSPPNIPSPVMVNPAGGTGHASSPLGSFALSLGAAILAFYIWEVAKKHRGGKHAK